MKPAVLCLMLLAALPTIARAQTAPHPPPPACAAPHHPPHGKHATPQCMAGSVTTVSAMQMQLQLAHGHAVKIVFTDHTVFQTDSGPGTLEGIMPGDFACVTGTPHGHTFQAKSVAFDLTPFPCPVKKPHPPKGHDAPRDGGAG